MRIFWNCLILGLTKIAWFANLPFANLPFTRLYTAILNQNSYFGMCIIQHYDTMLKLDRNEKSLFWEDCHLKSLHFKVLLYLLYFEPTHFHLHQSLVHISMNTLSVLSAIVKSISQNNQVKNYTVKFLHRKR